MQYTVRTRRVRDAASAITAVTVLPQLLLLMAILINPRPGKNRMGTPMLLAILLWTAYLVLQLFNETCGLPISVGNWLTNMNFYSFYFIISYILINKIVNTPKPMTLKTFPLSSLNSLPSILSYLPPRYC